MPRYSRLKYFVLCLCLISINAAFSAPDKLKSVTLTLDTVVKHALESNAELKVMKMDTEIADWDLYSEQSYWEPDLALSFTREENVRENTVEQSLSQFAAIFEEQNNLYGVNVEGTMPWGTKYRAGYNLSDLANNLTNLTFLTIDEFESQYLTFAGFSFTQPLLKNAGRKITESRIRNAELQQEIARQKYRRQKMLTIASAEAAWWNLWTADRTVELAEQSLDIARQLAEDNDKKFKQGKMARIEVEHAKAGVARRQRLLLQAQTRREESIQAVMRVLNWKIGSRKIIVPEKAESKGQTPGPDFHARMKTAVTRHPDLLIAEKETALNDLKIMIAENQRWPELDLVASYGLNGLGTSIGDSLDDVTNADFDSWTLGIMFKVPLGGGRGTKALCRKMELQKMKTLENHKATETDISNAIHTALKKVELLNKVLKALAQEVETDELALESEKVLLENGKSTSRKILELEEDLSSARIDNLLARAGVQKAMIQLDLVDGGMLDRRSMEEKAAPAAKIEKKKEKKVKKNTEKKDRKRFFLFGPRNEK